MRVCPVKARLSYVLQSNKSINCCSYDLHRLLIQEMNPIQSHCVVCYPYLNENGLKTADQKEKQHN